MWWRRGGGDVGGDEGVGMGYGHGGRKERRRRGVVEEAWRGSWCSRITPSPPQLFPDPRHARNDTPHQSPARGLPDTYTSHPRGATTAAAAARNQVDTIKLTFGGFTLRHLHTKSDAQKIHVITRNTETLET